MCSSDLITPLALILGNLAFAVGSAIETPARQAVVVNLVPRLDFTSAVALNNVGRNASPAVGSSLAGALYAIGGNEEVARLSGIPVKLQKTFVYVIAGALASVAGWVDMSTLDSAQPTAAGNYLLNVIAVVVIGGASLAGGVGTMGSTLLGLFVVGVINNGMSFTGISPNAKPVVIGIIIILAVLADRKGNSSR